MTRPYRVNKVKRAFLKILKMGNSMPLLHKNLPPNAQIKEESFLKVHYDFTIEEPGKYEECPLSKDAFHLHNNHLVNFHMDKPGTQGIWPSDVCPLD